MSDIILFWNEVALEANRISFTNGKGEQQGPTLSSRALAIVHVAMYDAYAAFMPATGTPYLTLKKPPTTPPAEALAAARAAVGAAAYTTLLTLYPSQKAFFDLKLPLASDVLNIGYAFGIIVAEKILDLRKKDPGAGSGNYKPSGNRGRHKEDPDNPGQGFHAATYGALSNTFVSTRYKLAAPPLHNPQYIFALKQVRAKGISPELMGTVPSAATTPVHFKPRTADETLTGIYWGYDGAPGLGTPPRLYNQIIRQTAKNNSEGGNARLFALVNVAMADAGILAWEQKYYHDFWRPVVGIREHDVSMGDTSVANNPIDPDCDPNWLPLGGPSTNGLNTMVNQKFLNLPVAPTFPHATTAKEIVKNFTPNFPAYPSGHATFGAAALHVARLFYGAPIGDRACDNCFEGLDFTSEECNGENQDNKGTVRPKHARKFNDGLWQMIIENGRSRVFLGVHWVFDAFAVDDNDNIDLLQGVDEVNGIVGVGGVPLGLSIAEDIFQKSFKLIEPVDEMA